ncbi:MAG: hypothetical protein FD122_2866 [Stygiobacter sp.]|nr:MAG: hypothetical protein FD122_2866 [Stygiobacter sp.]KAF0213908.1 MAG: hypothetical protein FD178_2747 [Ignavibacteria bacterium]
MTIENQIKNYISYGFHKYLGMTETEYMNSVSVNVSQPEKYQGIFDYPFFVETRIPIEEQIKLLGIDDYVNAANLTHLNEQINFPYIAWTHDLSLHAGKTISETHSSYLEIEIGCTAIEVIAFAVHYPSLCKGKGIDAPSTIFRGEYYVSLIVHEKNCELASHWIDDKTENFNCLTRGKEVTKL